ncbi:MAG: LytTR family DNA-binding domain-containing protein, partial [Lachnospiraceae bacterium]|nr:LytTR family DNA-binding domain-containing protein [Lachnospiraceae bacterium]
MRCPKAVFCEGGDGVDYRIAIVDDNEQDTKYVAALVRQWTEKAGHTAALSVFPSAEAFLFACEDEPGIDMLLLDIEMGAMNGVELAKKLRRADDPVQLVFITGFPDFIAEGYEVDALHYLMKPVAPEKLFAVLDKAASNIGRAEKRLCVTYDHKTDFVPLSQIYYVEAQKQYVLI